MRVYGLRRGADLERAVELCKAAGDDMLPSALPEAPGYPRSGWASQRSDEREQREERARAEQTVVRRRSDPPAQTLF